MWPDSINGSLFVSSTEILSQRRNLAATMEAAASSSSLCRIYVGSRPPRRMKSTASFVSPERSRRREGLMISNRRVRTPSAVGEFADTVAEPEITWQIIVGAIAGTTPFVVAGVEFTKRIIEQRRCEECRGTGLVFRDKKYFRCPECGGFLPWQSWRRFFTG